MSHVNETIDATATESSATQSSSTTTTILAIDLAPFVAPILDIDTPIAEPPANDHPLPTLHAGVPT